MPNLLAQLKADHAEILDILEEVKRLGSSSQPGREKLLSARSILLEHISKEDELFYPGLQKASATNEPLKRMLLYFLNDMNVVSRKAMEIFDKYAGASGDQDFEADITLLYMTLKDRIRTEEEVLFTQYERLGNGSEA